MQVIVSPIAIIIVTIIIIINIIVIIIVINIIISASAARLNCSDLAPASCPWPHALCPRALST